MDPLEKATLETAINTIADPLGNWEYGWKLICELAHMEPEKYPAPFRPRSAEDLEAALEARRRQPSTDPVPRVNPQGPNSPKA